MIDATQQELSLVAAFTEADDNVPVEVRRDHGSQIVSLRLCWTTDVDGSEDNGEGSWNTLTTLALPEGACIVWDPFHGDIDNGYVVDVKPSDYVVEAFYTEGLPRDATRGDREEK